MFYIFGKYNNQRVKWAIPYYTDNMVHCSCSSPMLSLISSLVSKYQSKILWLSRSVSLLSSPTLL